MVPDCGGRLADWCDVRGTPLVENRTQTEGVSRMGKKAREDESTKDLKKAVKAEGKPSKKEKKEEKNVDKITKHLSKTEKI
jgi:hypothetical protein